MSIKYVCDVCGADIRPGDRARVVAGALAPGVIPEHLITIIDFCPSCQPIVDAALQRLAEYRLEQVPASLPAAALQTGEHPPPSPEPARVPRLRTLPLRAVTYVSISIVAFLVATWLTQR
jgi:hypothetical protein